jgi:hypothetical protein
MNHRPFHLTKWYLDITTESGECFIGYAVNIRWNKIDLSYKGYILLTDNGAIRKSSSFRSFQAPEVTDHCGIWKTSFGSGHWKGLDGPIEEMLLDNNDGLINWSCVIPKAKASFKLNGHAEIEGLGYVEKMELTLPPWEIPITTLYWGRYLSQSYSLIWIEWKGPLPKVLIFLNGKKYQEGVIDNERISFGGYTLNMDTQTTLRTGSIGSTIFGRFRKIMALFPVAIFRMEENKWTGKATLLKSNMIIDSGRYIHEEVDWNY